MKQSLYATHLNRNARLLKIKKAEAVMLPRLFCICDLGY
ncbi:hypothetical protein MGA5115_02430 [Marinomonas gallaica]|uniref:Uncharacterized protein n=1 Tax=Marinomonas gallaica TaxID=1806667 RepID=A0A1C3JSV4_9GAMM|nr:hypothetical protein MGA5115_02430 [Marinomonas gallaica]SBT22358.1 hypothetical protein MGA5116_02975 [Marinomonas gallaica]